MHAALVDASTSSSSPKRVALIIGNSTYTKAPLKNPVNDARAMQTKLKGLGFEVLIRENLKTKDIGGVYREFRASITPGTVALVFYAGHGVQFKGQNYFPAVDADITSEDDVPLQSLNLGSLLDTMEEAKAGVSIVLLDACRHNPFSRRFRSASRGLAKVEAASGTLIHYATKPGGVADDGDGNNGIYTEALLAQISEPGQSVEQFLKRVTNRVIQKTGGTQEPWLEGSLRGEFYFFPQREGVFTESADPDLAAWKAAELADTKDAFAAYLKEYPKGKFAPAARIKLATLMKSGATRIEDVSRDSIASVRSPVALGPPSVLRAGVVFKDCDECPEMVVIPDGYFEVTPVKHEVDGEREKVRISKPFALAQTEITQLQWRSVMGSPWGLQMPKDCDDCPVNGISWELAVEFVRKLSELTGKNYRLPTEVEWEYACRAGGQHQYCGGDDMDAVAWYLRNSQGKVHAVATKQPNTWGLYDMSGNVDEWTNDCWVGYAGKECWKRVLRGGSRSGTPVSVKASARRAEVVPYFFEPNGLRPARSLP